MSSDNMICLLLGAAGGMVITMLIQQIGLRHAIQEANKPKDDPADWWKRGESPPDPYSDDEDLHSA